jgi:hypothetical protein
MFQGKPKLSYGDAPFDLIIGDNVFYEHKSTGDEIRLHRYSGKDGTSPELIQLSGANKHGSLFDMSASFLYENYTQKFQSDFTNPIDPRLPYVFDLFWGVKTLSGLISHIKELGTDAYLAEMIAEHEIELTEEGESYE